MNKAQAMLDALRVHYLNDLPSQLDELENLILHMDAHSFNLETCRELYRRIHSLKGSGGTYGMHIVSDVCHPFEDLISALIEQPGLLRDRFTPTALEYLDLLRRVIQQYQQQQIPGEEIRAQLSQIRLRTAQCSYSALIVESSDVIISVVRDILIPYRFRVEVVNDGYQALGRILSEPFDLVVTGLETPRLNGLALISAMQKSSPKHRHTQSVLVTASELKHDKELPDAILKKDAHFKESFSQFVHHLIQS
ncbi:response regulator [Undibacterium rugosum]|uniref:Hpt domain-containing protein n=1 Tax=Undibacterium rugosum TaxID=2762291 RepID=A0A923IAM9_9BURK|nr:response regulator [Undibacterium rugosum]MBC3936613.1 Hpt domain-containing protein [Undibacterium rugosum]MBR7776937.1 Hpt domain-containing protein [Undibacterium rugosum]